MPPDEGYSSHSYDLRFSEGSPRRAPSTLSRPTAGFTFIPQYISSPKKKHVVPRNADGLYSPRPTVEISPENLETSIEELRLELQGMHPNVDERATSRASKLSKSHHIHRPLSYAKKTLEEYDRLIGLYEQHVQNRRANIAESDFSIADSTLCASDSSPERLSIGSRRVEFPRRSSAYQSPPARQHRYVQKESRKLTDVHFPPSSSSSSENEMEKEEEVTAIRLAPITIPPRRDYSGERRRSAMSSHPPIGSLSPGSRRASNSSPLRLSSGSRRVEFPRRANAYHPPSSMSNGPPTTVESRPENELRKRNTCVYGTDKNPLSPSSRNEEREEHRTVIRPPIRVSPRRDESEERQRSAMSSGPPIRSLSPGSRRASNSSAERHSSGSRRVEFPRSANADHPPSPISNGPPTTVESLPDSERRKRNQERIALIRRNLANTNPPPKNLVTTASTSDRFAPVQDVDKISKKRHSAVDSHRTLSGSSVRNLINPVRERVVQRTNSLGRNRKPTRNAFVSSSNV